MPYILKKQRLFVVLEVTFPVVGTTVTLVAIWTLFIGNAVTVLEAKSANHIISEKGRYSEKGGATGIVNTAIMIWSGAGDSGAGELGDVEAIGEDGAAS